MFGKPFGGAQAYGKIGLETGVLAASPAKLIIMLYDGAIESCRQAAAFIDTKNYIEKGRALTKVSNIIDQGLLKVIDVEKGGEIALNLQSLYMHMLEQLAAANLNNEKEPVLHVRELLTELRSSWQALEKGHQPSFSQ